MGATCNLLSSKKCQSGRPNWRVTLGRAENSSKNSKENHSTAGMENMKCLNLSLGSFSDLGTYYTSSETGESEQLADKKK